MKVVFLIQGEGNGHLTQAISLHQMLRKNGHQVVAALIGSASGTKKPGFFTTAVDCPVYGFRSIGLAYDRKGQLSVSRTLTKLAASIPAISISLRQIHSVVRKTKPDLIVNFYETCSGLYNLVFRNRIPVVSIAHQYLMEHPDFVFPAGKHLHRQGLRLLNKVTAFGSARILALSFSDLYASTTKIRVVPPLLRREVLEMTPTTESHLLVYLTQPLLRGEIEKWHDQNPSVRIHCFCNDPRQTEVEQVNNSLFFHPNDTTTFLQLLRTCAAFASTSGFESVCEAMLLGKPTLLVPIAHHYEQECNALDAVLNRIGISDSTFRLDRLLDYLPAHQSQTAKAQNWLKKSNPLILQTLEWLTSGANSAKTNF